jgi:hypothetical protein
LGPEARIGVEPQIASNRMTVTMRNVFFMFVLLIKSVEFAREKAASRRLIVKLRIFLPIAASNGF